MRVLTAPPWPSNCPPLSPPILKVFLWTGEVRAPKRDEWCAVYGGGPVPVLVCAEDDWPPSALWPILLPRMEAL